MIRTFVEMPIFNKRWEEIGYNEEDLLNLQKLLLKNPEAGPVMEGTGGIRKVRFALPGRGKSGGSRVCYVDYIEYETIYLITVYTKDEQDNLTKEQKNNLKQLVKALKEEISRRWRK